MVQQWRSLLNEASKLVKFLCVLHITGNYVVAFAKAPGPSMLPTMNIPGDIVVIDRFSPRFGKVVRGNIVIVRSPENPSKIVTKRLIAMEGDSVTFLVDPKNSERSESVVVPKGHIWVQGDNIYNSRDSRAFGPVPYGLLFGKVFWRVWPLKDFGPL